MSILKLIGKFGRVGSSGQVDIPGRSEDFDFLAEILNGIEVDGFWFGVKHIGSAEIEIIMKGESLSDKITSNYTDKKGAPLYQIGFSKPEGKKTANILNKFLRKCNKILTKGNHMSNVVMIREAEIVSD